MIRRMSALAVAATLVLSFAACSKKDEGGNTATSEASSTTTEKKSSDTTEHKSSDTTEHKSSGTTEKKSTGTTSKSSGKSGSTNKRTEEFQLTADEEDCIDTQARAAGYSDPSLAVNDAKMAGAIGGIMVNCIPKPRLATGLTEAIKENPKTATLSAKQEQCIRDEILSANDEDLALFVGVLIFGDQTGNQTLSVPFEDALNDACNTNISLEL